MNKILSGLSLLCLVLLGGCSQENFRVPEVQVNEGDEVTVRFSVVIPEFKTVQTRANGGVNDMYLLVFDENGNFIVREQATLTNQTETGGTFTASLPPSSSRRVVHFVSNLDESAFNDAPGVNEATVVALLSTANASFWSRVELSSGISATSFNGMTVELLRNQAKISVINDASNFTYAGFTIHNAPGKGTVAPYSVAGGFTGGIITEPSGVTLLPAQSSGISTGEKYLFERKNAAASSITTVIVQGTYAGQSYYYKIDLIDAGRNRYDIERNWHYVVKIKTVTRAGYANFDDALAGASHNNTALDPIIEKYPMISDGIRKLEIEKTLVILTQPGETLHVWAKYFPDINSSTVDNSGVTVALAPGNEALNGASLNFDSSTGIITAMALSVLPSESKEARIVVTQDDLARTIRVVLRPPFSFNPVTINDANPGRIINGQSQDGILRFNIPDDFPDDLFPLPIKIYTQGLYPAAAGLEMVVEAGQIYYIYRATQRGQQTVSFKSNKSDNTETVTLKADYFTDGAVPYIAFAPYEGDITYAGNNVPTSGAGNLSVTAGSIALTANGKYKYTPPANPDMSTPVIITYYTGSNPRIYYAATTTIGDLYEMSTINMVSAFTGRITYGSNTNVPNNATVTASVGSVVIQNNGVYRYTPPANFDMDTPVTLTYTRTSGGNQGNYVVITTIGSLYNNNNFNMVSAFTGTLTYGSNTNVPNSATVTASVGSVAVPSAGTYRYTPPISFEANTPVVLAYIRQVLSNTNGSIQQTFHEHCSVTTTVGNLQGNGSLNLGFDQFVVTGRIRYTTNTNNYNNLQNVPNNATLTVTGTAGATGRMLATQRYELTIPGNAAGSATIRVSYTTGGRTYYAETTVNAFRTNQYLQLRTNGGRLNN